MGHISKDNKDIARMKQVEAYHYLGALASENTIAQETYHYISENLLWVLHNIIDELPDTKEDESEEPVGPAPEDVYETDIDGSI